MITIEEIEAWRTKRKLTRRLLAEKMHTGYSGLCQVLAGKRKLTKNFARRIEEVMKSEQESIKITVPAEYEAKVRAWAEQAHMQIDDLLHSLLEGMISGKITSRH